MTLASQSSFLNSEGKEPRALITGKRPKAVMRAYRYHNADTTD